MPTAFSGLSLRFSFALALLLAPLVTVRLAAAEGAPAATTTSASPATLHLNAPGDLLSVRLYDEGGQGEKSYQVDATGSVKFPLIGEIKLAGLTLTAAEDLIGNRFTSEYAVKPHTKIELMSASPTSTEPAPTMGFVLRATPDGWSQPVRGLRARLAVLPPPQGSPSFCRVMLEFEHVSDVVGQIKIRFTPARLRLQVTDRSGKRLAVAGRGYDGVAPTWEPIPLPFGGTVRFQVSFPGLGFRPEDKLIIDAGTENAWVVPQDGTTYYLSGSLTIPGEKGDRPFLDWSGTIGLPQAEIPAAGR